MSRGSTPSNRDDAGSSTTTVGNTSGGQNAVTVWLESFGSIGKAQAPSPGEVRASGALLPGDGGRPARNPLIVALITRIASHEFPRKSLSIKAPQILFAVWRPPVRSWPHDVAPVPRMPIAPLARTHVCAIQPICRGHHVMPSQHQSLRVGNGVSEKDKFHFENQIQKRTNSSKVPGRQNVYRECANRPGDQVFGERSMHGRYARFQSGGDHLSIERGTAQQMTIPTIAHPLGASQMALPRSPGALRLPRRIDL